MKHAGLITGVGVLLALLLGACTPENEPEVDRRQVILDRIWKGYEQMNRDPSVHYTNVSGRILKAGTVPPSVMDSTGEERLPAYLACYEAVMVIMDSARTDFDMCMFYAEDPERGTFRLSPRGQEYMDRLEAIMATTGFRRSGHDPATKFKCDGTPEESITINDGVDWISAKEYCASIGKEAVYAHEVGR